MIIKTQKPNKSLWDLACQICGIMFLLTAPHSALASAQMQDGQDYPLATSTPVTGRSPWFMASSGGAPAGSTSYIGIYAGDLTGTTAPPLAGLTNVVNPEAHLQIAKAGSSSRTYYRSIGASLSGGSVYFSFLMSVSANPNTSDEILCELIPAVAGGSYPANPAASDPLTLHVQQGADSSHFNLGIQSLNGTVSWADISLADGTDYLVVLEYTFGAGQPCQLFINPVPGMAQPAANATAIKGTTAEPTNLGTVQYWESSTATSITSDYDVMRVDANWTNVTPPGNAMIVTTNPPPMRLLFLGDSLLGISTAYSNNIPAILMNLAENLGDDVTNTIIANASWYLYMFATNTAALNQINSGNFDLVVLQDQSQEPSLPVPRDNSMFPACRTLNSVITNSAEKTMFYETWGLLNGDTAGNCGSYDIPPQYLDCDGGFGSFLSMNIALREGYAMIGNQLIAAVSPVGLAWATVRQQQPGLNLYILDDSLGDRHPNSYGAYLAACVFYSTIFGRSPEGSTYYSTNDVSSAMYLQQVAAQTVLQDPFATDAYGFGTGHYYWAYDWQNYTNPPTSPANTIVISGASAIPSPSVKVDMNVGTVSNLWLGTFDTNYNAAGQGRLYLYPGGSIVVTGAMVLGKEGKGFVQQNGGSLTVNGTLTLAEQPNSSGEYTLSNGTLYAYQILAGAGNSSFNFLGGQLEFSQFGSAVQPLDLSSVTGTLMLSNALGTSFLFGSYTNGSSATLDFQLGSTSTALAVNGVASLAGTLALDFVPGFQPTPGQRFTLLSATSITGNFNEISVPSVGSNGLGLVTSLTSTSVVATIVNFAPALNSLLITNGIFQFTVNGVSNSQCALETSTNLTDWTLIVTNPAPFTYATNSANADRQRFYRAIYLP
jgi:hypothetical protein